MIYFLCIIISSVSLTLIIEAGSFLSSGIHGYILAFLLESVVVVAMVSNSDSRDFNIFRKALIASVLVVVTGAASLNAVQSVVMHTAPAGIKYRIAEVNRDIAALERSLENLKGQPKNSAIVSGKIRELLAKKSELMAQHRPDARLTTINVFSSVIPVLIRILLQIGNLFLITVLRNRLRENIFSMSKPETTSQSLSRPIITTPDNLIAGFTGHHGDSSSETSGIGFSMSADQQKICDYIRLKGGSICHQKLIESKQLSAGEYDDVLDALIASGVLTKNNNFNRAFTIYSLNRRSSV